jgi:hypothetical protein
LSPDGFSYVAKNRKIFKHKSGGIVVVYKNNLKNHIKFKYLIMTFYWDVYTPYLNFFLFEISLFQKFTILNFIHNISVGVLPSSPYIVCHKMLNYLWNQQQPVHSVQLKFIVKQNLTDQYIQNCFNQICGSN